MPDDCDYRDYHEPWSAGHGAEGAYLHDADGHHVIEIEYSGPGEPAELDVAPEYLERIAVCVNLLAGVPTRMLRDILDKGGRSMLAEIRRHITAWHEDNPHIFGSTEDDQ